MNKIVKLKKDNELPRRRACKHSLRRGAFDRKIYCTGVCCHYLLVEPVSKPGRPKGRVLKPAVDNRSASRDIDRVFTYRVGLPHITRRHR
jgi:hypothetical protein